jgi:hypothetical protein
LLWEEIHSDHYLSESKGNNAIWAEHTTFSDMVGRPAVNAHRYLYGILKMHKNPVGVRWIAGNHMQDMGDKDRKFPACSLSSAEMVLGGILRMCMHNLDSKDRGCRKKGYKRFWVVTNVDRVAADIKHNVNSLKGQPVFTRDFTRMYTSIPQDALASAVEIAVREVFEWHSQKSNASVESLRVKVTYPRPGHATAAFAKNGFSLQEIVVLLKAVCSEVYFQQGENAPVFKQKQGLPMGGKASAELANLYCYVKESQFIDSLIAEGNLQEAKRWFHTWRYIDDLTGFGDRGNSWEKIQYGMEHTETTEIRYSAKDRRSQAVFLGMKIDSKPDGIFTSVQPKGLGWAWLPRKFIHYSSCHTHYTKWYMLKGLLIRALTICNTQADFLQAAVHYSQGLICRGFPAKTLWRAWSKFCYEKITHPAARRNLMGQFKSWIDEQDFSTSHLDEEAQRRQKVITTTSYFKRNLMCGFHAVNHILSALNLSPVTEIEMDTTAQEMADRESNILYSMDPKMVLDLFADPRGNYAADTLIHLLHSRSGVAVERWRPDQPISSCAILLGSGDHWQAVLMDKDKQWFVLERITKHPIQNMMRFLNSKLANGAVYEVGIFDVLPNPSYLNSITASQHVKHLTTRSAAHNSSIQSPPRKRQILFQLPEAGFGLAMETDVRQPNDQIGSTLPGMILPTEFQQNPRFQFEGSKHDTVDNGPIHVGSSEDEPMGVEPMDVLLEAMTPPSPKRDDVISSPEETNDLPRRSTRTKNQPQFYQVDEVEREEKAARHNNP